jgi:exonuclease VII small subunit
VSLTSPVVSHLSIQQLIAEYAELRAENTNLREELERVSLKLDDANDHLDGARELYQRAIDLLQRGERPGFPDGSSERVIATMRDNADKRQPAQDVPETGEELDALINWGRE